MHVILVIYLCTPKVRIFLHTIHILRHFKLLKVFMIAV